MTNYQMPVVYTDEQRQAIYKLKCFREEFKAKKQRGCLQHFFGFIGSEYKAIKLFESTTGFCTAMKHAGYSKSYISEMRHKLKVSL